jgi:hypothetical protein
MMDADAFAARRIAVDVLVLHGVVGDQQARRSGRGREPGSAAAW